MKLTLYHYWRSSSSWRVRWALAYKGIPYDAVAVSLLDGESESEANRARNPMGYVPTLEVHGKGFIIESVAILEWLEENYPTPHLIPPLDSSKPDSSFRRAKIRALTETINAGTQPIQNLNVLDYLTETAGIASEHHASLRKTWATHWIHIGLSAFETLLSQGPYPSGKFSVGDELSYADLVLMPQCYNALRQEMKIENYPRIHQVSQNLSCLPSYLASHPDAFSPTT